MDTKPDYTLELAGKPFLIKAKKAKQQIPRLPHKSADWTSMTGALETDVSPYLQ